MISITLVCRRVAFKGVVCSHATGVDGSKMGT